MVYRSALLIISYPSIYNFKDRILLLFRQLVELFKLLYKFGNCAFTLRSCLLLNIILEQEGIEEFFCQALISMGSFYNFRH
jgi:hypothetical protein